MHGRRFFDIRNIWPADGHNRYYPLSLLLCMFASWFINVIWCAQFVVVEARVISASAESLKVRGFSRTNLFLKYEYAFSGKSYVSDQIYTTPLGRYVVRSGWGNAVREAHDLNERKSVLVYVSRLNHAYSGIEDSGMWFLYLASAFVALPLTNRLARSIRKFIHAFKQR
jgi:hypothetical protein